MWIFTVFLGGLISGLIFQVLIFPYLLANSYFSKFQFIKNFKEGKIIINTKEQIIVASFAMWLIMVFLLANASLSRARQGLQRNATDVVGRRLQAFVELSRLRGRVFLPPLVIDIEA